MTKESLQKDYLTLTKYVKDLTKEVGLTPETLQNKNIVLVYERFDAGLVVIDILLTSKKEPSYRLHVEGERSEVTTVYTDSGQVESREFTTPLPKVVNAGIKYSQTADGVLNYLRTF